MLTPLLPEDGCRSFTSKEQNADDGTLCLPLQGAAGGGILLFLLCWSRPGAVCVPPLRLPQPCSSAPRGGDAGPDPPGRAVPTMQSGSSPSLLPVSGVCRPQGCVPVEAAAVHGGVAHSAGAAAITLCQRFQGPIALPYLRFSSWLRERLLCSCCSAKLQPRHAAGDLLAPLGPGKTRLSTDG